MDETATALGSAMALLWHGGGALWWRIGADLAAVLAALVLAAVAAAVVAVPLVRVRFVGRALVVGLIRSSLFVPTVLLGLSAQWLLGEVSLPRNWLTLTLLLALLAWPLLVALLTGVLRTADPRAWETAITLGATPVGAAIAQFRDTRAAVHASLVAAAGRVTAETGCATLFWGGGLWCLPASPIAGPEALAVGIALLAIALLANLALAWYEERTETSSHG
jgi:tungstate transport system permease protein